MVNMDKDIFFLIFFYTEFFVEFIGKLVWVCESEIVIFDLYI